MMIRLGRLVNFDLFSVRSSVVFPAKFYSSSAGKREKNPADNVLPKNLLEDFHSASSQPDNGVIYDKKPFKMVLDPEKHYNWCLCGQSKSQIGGPDEQYYGLFDLPK